MSLAHTRAALAEPWRPHWVGSWKERSAGALERSFLGNAPVVRPYARLGYEPEAAPEAAPAAGALGSAAAAGAAGAAGAAAAGPLAVAGVAPTAVAAAATAGLAATAPGVEPAGRAFTRLAVSVAT